MAVLRDREPLQCTRPSPNDPTASNFPDNSCASAASNSTGLTSHSDVETEPSSKNPEDEWHIELPTYEKAVSEPSGLSVAIIKAIERKDYKIVARLLKSGENPLAKDDSGWCAFHYAVRADSKTVIRELLDSKAVKDNKGYDISNINGDTALHFASLLGKRAMAKELLKAGANENALNHSGHSPLSIAVEKKQDCIVEVLLQCKAQCIPPNPEKLRKIRNNINYLKPKAP